MNNTPNEELDRDTLLLESLLDVVSDAHLMHDTISILARNGAEPTITNMLTSYGTLLNIIQAAIEQPDALNQPLTLHDRLSLAYYELTNNDPGADTDSIRLRDDD
jgi:hypothetical protein